VHRNINAKKINGGQIPINFTQKIRKLN
jgi:hypothetical protein